MTADQYSLASLRYDLSKLRAKGLVERVPKSRRYRLVGKGYAICVAFLKLFEKLYAPLTAGLVAPFRGDRVLGQDERCDGQGCGHRLSLMFRWSGLLHQGCCRREAGATTP